MCHGAEGVGGRGIEGEIQLQLSGPRGERYLPSSSYRSHYPFGPSVEELGIYSSGEATWFGQNVPIRRHTLIQYGSIMLFQHTNNLGTAMAVTDHTGAELQDELFHPWVQG